MSFTVEGSRVVAKLKHGTLILDVDNRHMLNRIWTSRRHGKTAYAACKGKLIHREILGAEQGQEVDHINRNGLDNRCENLRLATRALNTINRGLLKTNKSGFRGVSYDKASGRWVASIKHDGLQRMIGRFATAEEAARAWDAQAKRLRGGNAVLNFPNN